MHSTLLTTHQWKYYIICNLLYPMNLDIRTWCYFIYGDNCQPPAR